MDTTTVDVVLKNAEGQDMIYYGVSEVKLRTADGGSQVFSIGGENGGEGDGELAPKPIFMLMGPIPVVGKATLFDEYREYTYAKISAIPVVGKAVLHGTYREILFIEKTEG